MATDDILAQVSQHLEEVMSFSETDAAKLEEFRIKYLGSKGIIKELFKEFRNVPNDQKKLFGEQLNKLKENTQARFDELSASSQGSQKSKSDEEFDLTRPSVGSSVGARHPISVVRKRILEIFKRMGYSVAEGPEIEDDWHNFTALNFPEEHPARDMQDTFFIDKQVALRTHTSSVQVRTMEENDPPIRIVAPGRVFRNEAISARAHCIFHQVEGLYIDQDVSFADMKKDLLQFAQEFFGADAKIRLRPSYFPFTEPSAEMDVYWGLETEADYRITKGTGWLEIMGCGMVDPNVLKNCKIDPKKYSGFAFGMGIERIAMLLYGVKDLRLFFENDLRFLKQFESAWY